MAFVEPQPSNGAASTAAVDIVAIYRADTGDQVFASARPVDARVLEDARAMAHPLENGSSIVDHLVYLPTEIDFALRVTAVDPGPVYEEIRELFRAGTLLTVQTRTAAYENQFITGLPHEERASGPVSIDLRLSEAVFVETQYAGAVAPITQPRPATVATVSAGSGASSTSTANRGSQQTTAPDAETEERGSILYRLFRGGGDD